MSEQAAISQAKREDKHNENGRVRGEGWDESGTGGNRMSRMTLLHTSTSFLVSTVPRQPRTVGLWRRAIRRREAVRDNGCKGAGGSGCSSKEVDTARIAEVYETRAAATAVECSYPALVLKNLS